MGMTATEILEVLKMCRELGVTHFEGNGLKLEFGQKEAPILGVEDAKASQRSIDETEIRIKQEELENLKLTDPYTYEQIIAHDIGKGMI